MHVLLIFLDGIGLGDDEPDVNPFAVMDTPTLHSLSGGQRWLADTPRIESDRAVFLPTDACLGISGRPQSASGQAAIMTGLNVPQIIGEHYGPRPNAPIREIIDNGNLFKTLVANDKSAALINPFPPPFHAAIERGKRLPSSIQQSVLSAGLPLFTEKHYFERQALSPDWTGEGWTRFLGYENAPVYDAGEAGRKMIDLTRQRDFTMFSTWFTDEIGHRGPFDRGVMFMERFDKVMEAALDEWDDDEGLIIITSDHGNMEVQGSRKHTENQVPTVVIGNHKNEFADDFTDLTHITPGILKALDIHS
jgi:2,3-bisphosphoglycerate-independent phosphoglycerate mutase